MTRALELVAATADGRLELRRRGGDFLLLEGGRVLMNGAADRSERLLAEAACERIGARRAPHVLIAGLGMGITLRAALERLPARAAVHVSELVPEIVHWCRGPLRALSGAALDDARVHVAVEDVREPIARAARGEAARWHAILLDLSAGPAPRGLRHDPLYGPAALGAAASALAPGGVLGVWGEQPSPAFERGLARAGLAHACLRPRAPRRHVVYLAWEGTRRGRGVR